MSCDEHALVRVNKHEDRPIKFCLCNWFLKTLYSNILGEKWASTCKPNWLCYNSEKKELWEVCGERSWQKPVLIQITGQHSYDAVLLWVLKIH